MPKKNHNARRQKAAAKAKARQKRVHQAQVAEKERLRLDQKAKENWPSKREFPDAEYLYWLCHGVNYLNSDLKEGIWKPIFNSIYEGQLPNPETLAQTLLASAEDKETIGWAAQPRLVVYAMRQKALAKMRASHPPETSKEILLEKIKEPMKAEVWGVFLELRQILQKRREAREAQEVDQDSTPPELESEPLEGDVLQTKDISPAIPF